MLSDRLKSEILKQLKHEPTLGQEKASTLMAEFILNPNAREVFILKGYAGTGKTTLIGAMVEVLKQFKQRCVLLAPTGRAAKVLSIYSKKQAYTIHKHIYRQKSLKDGFSEFNLDRNLHSNTLFIVDEASMVSNSTGGGSAFGSGQLLDDLFGYVYGGTNCKLMLVGDVAQLPPVGMDISPALDPDEVRKYGYDVKEHVLSEVVRQRDDSGILSNATCIREKIQDGDISQNFLETKNFPDVKKVNGVDLIEMITDSYDSVGQSETVVICYSNKRANKYNEGIRNAVLYYEDMLVQGDLLMIVKNNYFWIEANENVDFIANGDIARIERIRGYEERYGYQYANVTLSFPDYDNLEIDTKIMIDTLTLEGPSLNSEANKQLFFSVLEDYADLSTKKKRYEAVKNDKFFNALQVKFAYAVTCHKAQGGQWKNVFLDQGYFVEDMLTREYLRWLYTAITRATENLYLVNFDKKLLK